MTAFCVDNTTTIRPFTCKLSKVLPSNSRVDCVVHINYPLYQLYMTAKMCWSSRIFLINHIFHLASKKMAPKTIEITLKISQKPRDMKWHWCKVCVLLFFFWGEYTPIAMTYKIMIKCFIWSPPSDKERAHLQRTSLFKCLRNVFAVLFQQRTKMWHNWNTKMKVLSRKLQIVVAVFKTKPVWNDLKHSTRNTSYRFYQF